MINVIVAVLEEKEIGLHQKLNLDIPDENLTYVTRYPVQKKYKDFKVVTQNGSGIYNALNFGINTLSNDFEAYIVCGSDDVIYFQNCLRVWNENKAFICGRFHVGDTEIEHQAKRWLVTDAHKSVISEHSVGTIIPLSLHKKHGMYDENYKIAGDAEFILRAASRADYPIKCDEVFGRYSITGLSQRQYSLGQSELRCAMGKYFPAKARIFNIISKLRVLRR